jgi:hypothetical protein
MKTQPSHIYLRILPVILITPFIAAGCVNASRSSSPTASFIGDVATTSSTSENLPSGWGTYRNNEDHYSISYPSSSAVSIAHPTYAPGSTRLGWSPSAGDYVDIRVYDASGLSLGDWLKKGGGTPPDSESYFDAKDGQFVLGYYPAGGFVKASMESRQGVVYQLYFQAMSYGEQYPPFWQDMLKTFELLSPSVQVACTDASCN